VYWVKEAVTNQFGTTTLGDRPIWPDLKRVMKNTAQLVIVAEMLAILLAVVMASALQRMRLYQREYGLTELYGPGTGIECAEHDGIHYWDDHYVVEIVDPVTGEPRPAGEEGEIVLTTLRKQAMPLVRYRTRDLSRLYTVPCACGSPYPRIARLSGRTDDMVKVRGVALYPADVDQVLSRIPGLGSEYQLHVHRQAGREDLLIRVEGASTDAPGDLAGRVEAAVRGVLSLRPSVEVVEPGALPRSERKTRRVFDHRGET
jgi:phenylacetate-CoA ligase